MKKRMAFIMLGMIVLLLSCAHRELKLPEPSPSATNASQVNIIREDRFFSFGFGLTVMLDDAVICSLRAGEYVTFAVDPGFHNLGLSESRITVPFAAKRNYYFVIRTSNDEFGFEIERINERKGAYLISISKVF